MERIGLIAGNRKFPLILAECAKKKGLYVVCVAIKGDTCPHLRKSVDKIYWLGLDEFSRMFEIFHREAVVNVVMAGQVSPRRLFSKEINKDPQLSRILGSLKDKRADTLFGAVAKRLEADGFKLLDSTAFVGEYIPAKGTLSRSEPDFDIWEDAYFGWGLAKEVAQLDIGQTVAVKSKAIVAVEALEGTDNLIRRAGKLSRGGATIVKVSKPRQDPRFDIPVVGYNTFKNLVRSKCRCLVFEAGKTLFIDRRESLRLADKHGVAVVAL